MAKPKGVRGAGYALDDRFDRRNARIQNGLMIEREKRPQRVPFLTNGEDLVLGVERVDHVRRIDRDGPRFDSLERSFAGGLRRGECLRHPVRQWKRDIEILGNNERRQFLGRSMDVSFAAVPAER